MDDCTGRIVRSAAGHDRQLLYYVIGTQGDFLLLCNGKQRTLSRPKRKRRRHVEILSQEEQSHPTSEKLRQNQPTSDRELRRALAAFKGGNLAWQKTI